MKYEAKSVVLMMPYEEAVICPSVLTILRTVPDKQQRITAARQVPIVTTNALHTFSGTISWVITAIVTGLWMRMAGQALKAEKNRFAFALLVIAFHAFSEPKFLDINYNVFLVMPFCPVDRLHMHGLCILTDGITTRCCGLSLASCQKATISCFDGWAKMGQTL